jgi:light-regulated signal transduction histidine kinase (bacteriophytochrome)
LSSDLEQTVTERTRELSDAVEELKAEVARRTAAEQKVNELNAMLERKVEDKTAELKDTLNELETFSYSISHDLKAPLHRIAGFCDILKSDHTESLPSEVSRIVERIINAQVTMSAYIEGLLHLSRFSRAQLAIREVDLGDVVRELFNELSPEFPEQAVTFSSVSLRAACDPVLIRFALQNLLTNALKFSRNNPEPVIAFEGEFLEQETVCWIRDNGIGFSGSGDDLFIAFNRGADKNEFEGSGIGLAIVKKIVSRHGGRVFAESSPGNGAVIGFALPRVP